MNKELKAPFHADNIKWRVGATNQDKTSALALAYIDARAVMDRLNAVCGFDGWQDKYHGLQNGIIVCSIGIKINDEWIWKSDGAGMTDVEGEKGGMSDAFKRAAVKWGIGRYLYSLPAQWVACEKRGKSAVLKETPKLPNWALPGGMDNGAATEKRESLKEKIKESTDPKTERPESAKDLFKYYSYTDKQGLTRQTAADIVKECGGDAQVAFDKVNKMHGKES